MVHVYPGKRVMKQNDRSLKLFFHPLDLFFYGYIIAIFVLSFFPLKNPLPRIHSLPPDFVAHTLMYAVGAILGWISFRKRFTSQVNQLLIPGVFLLLIGVLTESVQTLIPYREGSFHDFLADILGIGISSGVILMIQFVSSGIKKTFHKTTVLLIIFVSLLGTTFPGASKAQATQESMAIFSFKDVKPGLKGIVYTTTKGNEPQSFPVEILGVLENVLPDLSIILGKVGGEQFEKTGIFAGMSGSPVFIDGKIVGAVAYGWQFSKDAIAGIVPIELMLKGTPAYHASTRSVVSQNIFDEAISALAIGTHEQLTSFMDTLTSAFLPRIQPSLRMAGLQPIPLATQGDQALITLFNELLNAERGIFTSTFQTSPGTTTPPNLLPQSNKPIQPGSPIAIPLVRGDAHITVLGTLTYIDQKRFYAFGHPLFNLGELNFPVYSAYTYTVLPSLSSSFVFGTALKPLGILKHDYWTAVSGEFGPIPDMIPVSIQRTIDTLSTTFSYEIVNHKWVGPFFLQQLLFLNLYYSPIGFHDGSVSFSADIELSRYGNIRVENTYTGFSAFQDASMFLAGVTALLMDNPFETLTLKTLSIQLETSPEPRSATLSEVRLLSQNYKPGKKIPLQISILPTRKPEIRLSEEIRIPEGAKPGMYYLYVGGAKTLNQMDSAVYQRYLRIRSFKEMLRFLRHLRKNNGLYIRLIRYSPTFIEGTRPFRNLPMSVYRLFKSSSSSGGSSLIPFEIIMERRVDSPYIIQGVQRFQIYIKPDISRFEKSKGQQEKKR